MTLWERIERWREWQAKDMVNCGMCANDLEADLRELMEIVRRS